MQLNSPEISYIPSRTSKSPRACGPACSAEWPGSAAVWGDSVADHRVIWCPLRCVAFFILSKNNAKRETHRVREQDSKDWSSSWSGAAQFVCSLFVVVRFQSFITASLLMVSEKDERSSRRRWRCSGNKNQTKLVLNCCCLFFPLLFCICCAALCCCICFILIFAHFYFRLCFYEAAAAAAATHAQR